MKLVNHFHCGWSSKSPSDFLKNILRDAITRQKDVFPTDVSWVLTIPAIWSEPAKQFMRKAAEEVQLYQGKDKKTPLFLVLCATRVFICIINVRLLLSQFSRTIFLKKVPYCSNHIWVYFYSRFSNETYKNRLYDLDKKYILLLTDENRN